MPPAGLPHTRGNPAREPGPGACAARGPAHRGPPGALLPSPGLPHRRQGPPSPAAPPHYPAPRRSPELPGPPEQPLPGFPPPPARGLPPPLLPGRSLPPGALPPSPGSPGSAGPSLPSFPPPPARGASSPASTGAASPTWDVPPHLRGCRTGGRGRLPRQPLLLTRGLPRSPGLPGSPSSPFPAFLCLLRGPASPASTGAVSSTWDVPPVSGAAAPAAEAAFPGSPSSSPLCFTGSSYTYIYFSSSVMAYCSFLVRWPFFRGPPGAWLFLLFRLPLGLLSPVAAFLSPAPRPFPWPWGRRAPSAWGPPGAWAGKTQTWRTGPGMELTPMSPPWSFKMVRTRYSPRPMPFLSRLRDLSPL